MLNNNELIKEITDQKATGNSIIIAKVFLILKTLVHISHTECRIEKKKKQTSRGSQFLFATLILALPN